MRNRHIVIVFLLFCALASAQEAYNNDAVAKLVKAGLSDDLIISTINNSPGKYDISADGIIALKAAGASDKVISAILLKTEAAPPPRPLKGVQPPQDPNDPMAQHEPGIYLLMTGRDRHRRMVLLKPAGAQLRSSNNLGNFASLGWSGKRILADIPGPHAALRTSETKPVFYIYYPPSGTLGLTSSMDKPSEDFNLRLLEIEKDHRLTTMAQFSQRRSNMAKPNHDKWTVTFTPEMIRPYAYKIIPDAELSPGEYAFTEESSNATASVGTVYTHTNAKVFDFGVD